MTYKHILQAIDRIQLKSFTTIEDFRVLDHGNPNSLGTEQQGMYWIWTNLSNEDLKQIDTIEGSKEVPIAWLTERRENLNNSCHHSHEGFRIVYNGIGSGLRERILQEFNCNAAKTGTLNLERRTTLANWRISFFNFTDPSNRSLIDLFSDEKYAHYYWAETLEVDWRLEFGWPILNRR